MAVLTPEQQIVMEALRASLIAELEERQPGATVMELFEWAEAVATAVVLNVAETNTINDKTYTHVQVTAATTWNITHNLNKHPSVSVIDSADKVVYGDVEYTGINSLSVTFSAAFAGKAYCN